MKILTREFRIARVTPSSSQIFPRKTGSTTSVKTVSSVVEFITSTSVVASASGLSQGFYAYNKSGEDFFVNIPALLIGVAFTVQAILANRKKCSFADPTYQTCSSLVLTNLMAGAAYNRTYFKRLHRHFFKQRFM